MMDIRVCGVLPGSEPAGGGGRSTANAVVTELMAENTRLKELNREMAGMLEDISYYELSSDVYATIKELLAKARGRVK